MAHDAEEIAGVFGRAAATYDTVIPFFTAFGARLVALADLRPGESVLDVGAGRGATVFPAAERVGPQGRVVGIDLAEEMVAGLSEDIAGRGLLQASARRMDAHDLDVEPESFDVVLSGFLLHMLPDPPRAAAAMARALRRGGRCAVVTPTGRLGWEFIGDLFGTYVPRATRPVVTPFRPNFDPAALLAGTGLDVVESFADEVEFHFTDERTWWAWAWSQGMRGLFEVLAPADLEALRQELFAELAAHRTEAGIAMTQRAAFVRADKPR